MFNILINQFGVTGLIAFLLYIYMKNGFRQTEKLIENLDKLSDSIHDIIVKDTQKTVITENVVDDMKKLYSDTIRLLSDIENRLVVIEARTALCPNIIEVLKDKRGV